jgi:hypothetical protein
MKTDSSGLIMASLASLFSASIGPMTAPAAAGLLGALCATAPAIAAAGDDPAMASPGALASLRTYLQTEPAKRPAISNQAFAATPLTREDAAAAQRLLWEAHARLLRESRAEEMKERKLREGRLEMPFFYRIFGEKPSTGRSLFISMHGGGNAPKAVNDSQYENQKKLYRPKEGVYLAPRAPTDTWNLWHEGHIDRFFARLIEDLIVFEDVDPNRVYILGYSAGGDGVYQLAPRMADQLAAASMMAGHPNDASPLGLRNLPFAIHVGALDGGYNRNKVAADWGKKLDELRQADPGGYEHVVKIHAGKSHWMDLEDAEALPWMAQYTRDPLPKRVVWRQSGTTHARFYWLAVDAEQRKGGTKVEASCKDQQIEVRTSDVSRLRVRVNDKMLDLDKALTVLCEGQKVFEGKVSRTIGTLAKTLAERADPAALFSGEIEIQVPAPKK